MYLQPGAEFELLHLQILSGGDRLAGLVQWASMLGGLVGTSLIAQYLKSNTESGASLAAGAEASSVLTLLNSIATSSRDWFFEPTATQRMPNGQTR